MKTFLLSHSRDMDLSNDSGVVVADKCQLEASSPCILVMFDRSWHKSSIVAPFGAIKKGVDISFVFLAESSVGRGNKVSDTCSVIARLAFRALEGEFMEVDGALGVDFDGGELMIPDVVYSADLLAD